jgi:hypothetical protein
MNAEQTKYYRMFLTVQNTLDENTSIWSGSQRFVDTKNAFDAELEAAHSLNAMASQRTTGGTRNKEQVREALQAKLLVLGGTLYAHATLENNENLKAMLEPTKTGLRLQRETELVTYAELLLKEALPLTDTLANEYGLPAVQLDELETTLDEFRPLIGTPKQRQAAINAAKQSLEVHLDRANNLLRNVLDPLMLRYQFVNPQFYTAYEQSRTLID